MLTMVIDTRNTLAKMNKPNSRKDPVRKGAPRPELLPHFNDHLPAALALTEPLTELEYGGDRRAQVLANMPSVETIQRELAAARHLDDFFGKSGIMARLFGATLEGLLEAEMSEHLGYARYGRRTESESESESEGIVPSEDQDERKEDRLAGRKANTRNGKRDRTIRSSMGDVTIQVPRDRHSTFDPKILAAYQTSTNELEKKVIYLYAKGVTNRDIVDTLQDLYGVELTPATISAITDKVKGLAESWQRRPLSPVYPIVYLDAIVVKLRREGKVENVAVPIAMGVDLQGHKDILGHWIGTGNEGAKYWLSVLSELQGRGVKDIFIACVDGLSGFSEAIGAVFPRTLVQRCLVHQVRTSLRFVNYKDRKAFCADLRTIYGAVNRAEAEEQLLVVTEKWGHKYGAAMRSWENNWEELAVMFEFPAEIRRLIYTTNPIESYNRQLRRVTKTKGSFPSDDAVSKILYLAQSEIAEKWTMPLPNWASIANQLAIYFEERFEA